MAIGLSIKEEYSLFFRYLTITDSYVCNLGSANFAEINICLVLTKK